MTTGDTRASRLAGTGLRSAWVVVLTVLSALVVGLAGVASAAVAAEPPPAGQSSALVPIVASPHSYDHCPDVARPPPSEDEPYVYDTPSELVDSAANGGRVLRGFSASDARLVAPSRAAGSIRNVNPLGGTQNCVNCVIATDARLAGRPASALNSAVPQPISVLEQHFGGTFKQVAGRWEIERILSSAGPGSRGIVFGSRGADPGHVFNAVNQNGVIRFLDGQSGSVASFDGFSGFYFLPTS